GCSIRLNQPMNRVRMRLGTRFVTTKLTRSWWSARSTSVGSFIHLIPGVPRLLLSRAKHPSLHGHARIARWLARQMPYYEFTGDAFFAADGAPQEVAAQRRRGFTRLADDLARRAPETIRVTEALASSVSDLQFTTAYRVPFQFRSYANQKLKM